MHPFIPYREAEKLENNFILFFSADNYEEVLELVSKELNHLKV